jgi:hypothetical protein
MKRVLVQTQLSNYDTKGRFILEADSGWQMCMGRIREMMKVVPDLFVDVMGPIAAGPLSQVVTQPKEVNPDLPWGFQLNYIPHYIEPNALATRYDFNFRDIAHRLNLTSFEPLRKYDTVYINDPMHLRNFQALFHLKGGHRPRFVVHSHFIDNPECPKFPIDASLWFGQMEAALKADWNFWQCESSLKTFINSSRNWLTEEHVQTIIDKSEPWDDGYSVAEIRSSINMDNVRFDVRRLKEIADNNVVVFVPNRIGGAGRSSDYTNCGKFMFDFLPNLRERRHDGFVVIAGNPSQKFSNNELSELCGSNGYISLVPDAFNRDEFKLIASLSDIAVGLYDQDTYGGTAARECIEQGCVPLWIDNYEYSTIAKLANWPYVARNDMKDLVIMADALIELCSKGLHKGWIPKLQHVVRERCSYEATTKVALTGLGLL